jgi:paraquat-inducible protein B
VLGGIALLVVGVIVLAGLHLFAGKQRMVVFFKQSVNGLLVGSAVKFKGIEIGKVIDIRINLPKEQQPPGEVRIPVIIEIDRRQLKEKGAPINFDNPEAISSLIKDGLRAQLETDNLLTNVRFVALDMKPETPIDLVSDPTAQYPELPSLLSSDEEVRQKVTDIVSNLARVDFAGLVESAKEVTEGAKAVVTSPDLLRAIQRLDLLTANLNVAAVELSRTANELGPQGTVGRSLAAASKNAELLTADSARAANSISLLINPDGAFLGDLEMTLGELHDASRSVHRLADQLSRDPAALIRGGTQ